ncbi:Cation_ATPase_N domain-containing protein [Psidium guajava]|nr:Cation_ATPase_N domain-containing protein [Psidium guajava]
MENSNYPQIYPGSQCFPPPSACVQPNSLSFDGNNTPTGSINDNNTPTWVIVSIVIVIVIFCGFLFYYIWGREGKIQIGKVTEAIEFVGAIVDLLKSVIMSMTEAGVVWQKQPASVGSPAVVISIPCPPKCPKCGHKFVSDTCHLCKP